MLFFFMQSSILSIEEYQIKISANPDKEPAGSNSQPGFNSSCRNQQSQPTHYYVNLLSFFINGKIIWILKRCLRVNFLVIYYQYMFDLYTHFDLYS